MSEMFNVVDYEVVQKLMENSGIFEKAQIVKN